MAHTPSTQRNIDTQTHAHTDKYRYHFYILQYLAHLAYMPKIQILYLTYHRLTHAQTLRHLHTRTHMYRDIDTQIQIHRDICMFVYKHTHTHLWEI